jgi:hypothetical protein
VEPPGPDRNAICLIDRVERYRRRGGRFVGLEVAENLLHRGMQVAVVEALPQPAQVVLPLAAPARITC